MSTVEQEKLTNALNAIDAATTPNSWLVAATCKGLMQGYDARWRESQSLYEILEVEQTLSAPLVNLETNRPSRTFCIAGKLDKVVREKLDTVVFDHKTTSQDISDPNAAYWRQLIVDSQASQYELLSLQNGMRIDRVVWDVVRKPGIRPKAIPKKEMAALLDGTYCGFKISQATIDEAKETGRENGELYQARLAQECIADPDRYFSRRGITRDREQLAEYASELWDVAQEIREARNNKRHYRNSGACFNYGSPCEFLGICSGYDTPESDRWTTRQKHPELGGAEDFNGLEILSHSRLREFQTCRRKHFYKYELAIERVDEEEKETLFFGSCWHIAMDAYWSADSLERLENGNCNESPAIAVGN